MGSLLMAGLYFESVSCCYVFKKFPKIFGIFFWKISLKVKQTKNCVCNYHNYLHFLNTHSNDLLPIFCFLCRYNGYPTFLPKILFDPKRFFFPEKHCSKKNYLDCTLVEKKIE